MELEDAPELNRNLESLIQEMDLEGHLIRSKASARFQSWDLLRFRCATLINNRGFTIVLAPETGHAGPGLSECNPTST